MDGIIDNSPKPNHHKTQYIQVTKLLQQFISTKEIKGSMKVIIKSAGPTASKAILLLTLLLLVIPFQQSEAQNSSQDCPQVLDRIPNLCDRIKCVRNITKEDCPQDAFFMPRYSLCNCCPACVRFVGIPPVEGPSEDDDEEVPDTPPCAATPEEREITLDPTCSGPSCPLRSNECMPGLLCNNQTLTCALPQPLGPVGCRQDCMYKKSLFRLGLHHWDPECQDDGYYAPKQCKGDFVNGLCYCVDRCGIRIFGREFRGLAENQTCECSRRVSELRDQGRIATLHCTPQGNYEPLQCDTDSALCYCVDPTTGRITGGGIPQTLWNTLPCMNLNITGGMRDGRYLRICESNHAASMKIINEGLDHGTTVRLPSVNCDYDGSYAAVQIAGTSKQCVYKNGSRIADYMANSFDNMDCNCARDLELYLSTGRPFSYPCEMRLGNYQQSYDFGAFASCVDRDGVPYGHLVPSRYRCCLQNECIESSGASCYHPVNNPNGYRACCQWPSNPPCPIS